MSDRILTLKKMYFNLSRRVGLLCEDSDIISFI